MPLASGVLRDARAESPQLTPNVLHNLTTAPVDNMAPNAASHHALCTASAVVRPVLMTPDSVPTKPSPATTYITDLMQSARVGGTMAFKAGCYHTFGAQGDCYEAPTVRVPEGCRAQLAKGGQAAVAPGAVLPDQIAAYNDLTLRFIRSPRAPVGWGLCLGLRNAYLSPNGQTRFDGNVGLGSLWRPWPSGVRCGPYLQEHLEMLDKHFRQLCNDVAASIIQSNLLISLNQSSFCFRLEGGPRIEFDVGGRLPYCRLQAKRTHISVHPHADPNIAERGVGLTFVHNAELINGEDKTLSLEVKLTASLGPPAALCEIDFAPAPPLEPPELEAAPPTSGPASTFSYAEALYKSLRARLPVEGSVTLAEQRRTPLQQLLPQVASLWADCQIECDETRLHFGQKNGCLHVRAERPIRVKLTPPVIFGELPRWLPRWLARALVLLAGLFSKVIVCILEEAERVAEPNVDGGTELFLRVSGQLRCQLAGWTIWSRRCARVVPIELPQDASLFRQVDRSVGDMCRDYARSPMVNLSHMMSLPHSDMRAESHKQTAVRLSPSRFMVAQKTSLLAGGNDMDDSSKISLKHVAQVVGPRSQRPFFFDASLSFFNGLRSHAVDLSVDECP